MSDNLLEFAPTRTLSLAIGFVVALLAGSVPDAAAEEETIALLSLEISGDAPPPELREQVQVHIAKGLATGRKLLGLAQTREALVGSPELLGCFSSECLERIGDALSIRCFARAVLVASGAHYELKLDLDGLEAGMGPVETELEAGQHRESASKEGYATSARTIEVLSGADGEQRFELPMVKPIGDAHYESRNYGNWKWGAGSFRHTTCLRHDSRSH
ncbi:MAG: PEGA domain-containing protein [Myxococcales bacterium]|nr:PEGA domain-containing protein [Myxococcales bacterium]